MKKRLRTIGYILLMILPCAEIAARITGWGPIENIDYKVDASPSDWLVGDTVLGIALNPGVYTVTLNDGLVFNTTHLPNKTRHIPSTDTSNRRVIFFGCSFTYGYGVNSEESFVGRVAHHLNEFKIENFGIPGHGTVQNWIQLKNQILHGNTPECVVVVYSKEHLERNVMNLSYRKALRIGFQNSNQSVSSNIGTARFPYFSDTTLNSIHYTSWENCYSNWWGRDKFAIVHALQSTFSDNQDVELTNEITEALLKDMKRLCEENQINSLFVNLDDNKFSKRFPTISLNEDNYVSVGFNFSDTTVTNAPFDNHPNSSGHEFIAQKIIPVLNRRLDEKE